MWIFLAVSVNRLKVSAFEKHYKEKQKDEDKMISKLLLLVLSLAISGESIYNKQPASMAKFALPSADLRVAETRGESQSNSERSGEAEIRRLMVLTSTTLLSQQTIKEMETNVRPAITNALPPGKYRAKLVDLFVAKYQSKLKAEDLKDRAIPIYKKHFSANEIKEMIRFYETPTGQKVIKEMPGLTVELQQMAQAWGEALGKESMAEALAEHPDLAKEFEAASQQAKP